MKEWKGKWKLTTIMGITVGGYYRDPFLHSELAKGRLRADSCCRSDCSVFLAMKVQLNSFSASQGEGKLPPWSLGQGALCVWYAS